MDWFEQLTGFRETDFESVKSKIILLSDSELKFEGKSRVFAYGNFSRPSLSDLKSRRSSVDDKEDGGTMAVEEIVGDIRKIILDPDLSSDSVIQVASQFNMLEMINPSITPFDGVTRYQYDRTQGPICSICCGAGTIYRNYFENNHNNFEDSGLMKYFDYKNGYLLTDTKRLKELNEYLNSLSLEEVNPIKESIRVGLQEDTEVVNFNEDIPGHKVSQVFCSAYPVSYNSEVENLENLEKISRLILESMYDSTFEFSISKLMSSSNLKRITVYITLLGGGAFGNLEPWISESICKSLIKYQSYPLDIKIVSYGRSNPEVVDVINYYFS